MTTLKTGELYKIAPKLRMICNGSEKVNTVRAEQAAGVAVFSPKLLTTELQRGPSAQIFTADDLAVERGTQGKIPDTIYVNVFVQVREGETGIPDSIVSVARGYTVVRQENLIVATVALSELNELAKDPAVVAIENPEHVRFTPPLEGAIVAEPEASLRPAALGAEHRGSGVLIGIVDVGGFDFAHPDFARESGTRFERIWDQGGNSRQAPRRYGYGAEIRAEHMNRAIASADDTSLPATELEPQSQMTPSSHATHVASIAAGGRGLCPEARIAGVLLELPKEDEDRRKSFYDSSRLAHAVDYLFKLGEELNLPVSVNISLGTNGHAHDASSATSRWIDYELAHVGRSVCVAAGNAGQEAPTAPGDWGFVTGRIHTSGQLASPKSAHLDLEWIVIGDGIADLSENELEIWYEPQDQFEVELIPPAGAPKIRVKPGEFIENRVLRDKTVVSIYNERYHPANGHNYIACYLSPFMSDEGVVGVATGTWTVRLHGLDVRDGTFHAWVERDDPRPLGPVSSRQAWFFPSFFSVKSNVDASSVSSLACGSRVISVANLDEAAGKIHITSSQGPTRDKRFKPEVCAPGTGVVAAHGFDAERMWVGKTGTSMASPYVAGVVGLMLAAEPTLTAAQIAGIIRRTAKLLPGANGFAWQNDAGFGQIDPVACLEEVQRFQIRKDITP